jgi:hypothetical protein
MKSLILLLLSQSILAATPLESLFQSVTQKLVAFKQCDLNKVWPEYSWQEVDYIYFSSPLNLKTFLFDFKNDVEIPFRYEDTPAFAHATYAKELIDEKVYLSYKLENWSGDGLKEESKLMKLILHENFHFFGQSNIREQISYATGRGDTYPYQIKPRLYRAMVIYHLAQALKLPTMMDLELSYAKFWNQKHKVEFPEDFISTGNMDLREGSATFSELYSYILMNNNCEFNRVTFNELFFLEDMGETHIAKFYHYTEADKDLQSYYGGMLAYMIDQLLLQSTSKLKERSGKGEFPIEALLEAYNETESKLKENIQQNISNVINIANNEVKNIVDEYQENKAKGYYLVSFDPYEIPSQGSYRLRKFIQTNEREFGFFEIMQEVQAHYESDSTKIIVEGANSYSMNSNDCGEYQDTYWIKDLKIGDEISYSSPNISIESNKFIVKDNMICLK